MVKEGSIEHSIAELPLVNAAPEWMSEKAIRTLFRDIWNNSKIPKRRKIRSNFTDKKIRCVYFF